MKSHNKLMIFLLSTVTLMAPITVRAADAAPPTPPAASPQDIKENADLGLLSKDGATSMQNVSLARMAIFEGRLDDAKKFINVADSELEKARLDETAFTKAESELKAPAAKTDAADPKTAAAVAPANIAQAPQAGEYQKPTANGVAPKTPASSTPVSWLPVDRSVTIAEDFTADPVKAKAVADATTSLKGGDSKGAIEKLKLAAVKVDIIVAVVPLLKTIDEVHQAAAMIDSGKYYEASQELRLAQADVRFDEVSNDATPPK